jgi:hypothetical protein
MISTSTADRDESVGAAAPTPASASTAVSPERLRLLMKHPQTGDQQVVPIGYSVPVLLAGPIPLLRRRNWGLAAVCVLLPIVGQILLAPQANKLHIRHLLRRGYRAVSTEPGRVSHIEWLLGMQLPRYAGRKTAA